MRAIGAIGANAAAVTGSAAATTAAGSVGAPAAVGAPIESAASIEAAEVLATTTVDILHANLDDMAIAAGASGVPIPVKMTTSNPTPQEVLATIDEVDVSKADKLEGLRTRLLDDLRSGRGVGRDIVSQLQTLDWLIPMLRRQEEKKRLMKQLMKALMMGVLTPSLIAQAKALGLMDFLKEAIKDMMLKGNISPQMAKAMSNMLAAAGIQIPELEWLVHVLENGPQGLGKANAVTGERALSAPGARLGAGGQSGPADAGIGANQ